MKSELDDFALLIFYLAVGLVLGGLSGLWRYRGGLAPRFFKGLAFVGGVLLGLSLILLGIAILLTGELSVD